MFPVKAGCVFILISFTSLILSGQATLTQEEALSKAKGLSPHLRAADGQLQHDRIREKAAWNLPDPELILESPSGAFMTLGVEQSMEFPTVYHRQRQLAGQQSRLSEAMVLMMENELRRKVRQAYLQWQFAISAYTLSASRDSVVAAIATAAARQHAAGEIDFVERTYTDVRLTETHTDFLSARAEVRAAFEQIRIYTGIADTMIPEPMHPERRDSLLHIMVSGMSEPDQFPRMQWSRQNESLAHSSVRLEKSRALPDLTIGYLNPAGRNTPLGMRMRLGVSVPLWFWQYKSNVKAAEIRQETLLYETEAVEYEWMIEWLDARNEVLKNHASLEYYETTGLVKAEEMIIAAKRMLDAGEYDFIRYLQTLSEAFQVRQHYISIVYAFNQAWIQVQYLTGQ